MRNKIIGENTISGLIYIIQYFKPNVWLIENPQTSYIWRFINEKFCLFGYHNLSYYNCYDLNFSKKPTIFFSNLKLELLNFHIKSNDRMNYCNYNERSAIPNSLLLDILYKIDSQ